MWRKSKKKERIKMRMQEHTSEKRMKVKLILGGETRKKRNGNGN